MKWLLIFWGMPVALICGWYGLSYYDMSFGIFMLTRQAHDLVFQIYGDVLGIPPADIPPLVARAMIIDSLLVFALMAFRRRKSIIAWWRRRQLAAAAAAREDSLSSAP